MRINIYIYIFGIFIVIIITNNTADSYYNTFYCVSDILNALHACIYSIYMHNCERVIILNMAWIHTCDACSALLTCGKTGSGARRSQRRVRDPANSPCTNYAVSMFPFHRRILRFPFPPPGSKAFISPRCLPPASFSGFDFGANATQLLMHPRLSRMRAM